MTQHLMVERILVEFSKPVDVGKRDDTDILIKKILAIGYTEWKDMGFSKGTLHYMKKNAEADKPFSLNAHVRERLEMWKQRILETSTL